MLQMTLGLSDLKLSDFSSISEKADTVTDIFMLIDAN